MTLTPTRVRILLVLLLVVQAAAVGYAGYFIGINTPCADEESFEIQPLPNQ